MFSILATTVISSLRHLPFAHLSWHYYIYRGLYWYWFLQLPSYLLQHGIVWPRSACQDASASVSGLSWGRAGKVSLVSDLNLMRYFKFNSNTCVWAAARQPQLGSIADIFNYFIWFRVSSEATSFSEQSGTVPCPSGGVGDSLELAAKIITDGRLEDLCFPGTVNFLEEF